MTETAPSPSAGLLHNPPIAGCRCAGVDCRLAPDGRLSLSYRGSLLAVAEPCIELATGPELQIRQLTCLPLEEGALRCGLRWIGSVDDAGGRCWGELLQELRICADGRVLLGLALRLLPNASEAAVRLAAWRLRGTPQSGLRVRSPTPERIDAVDDALLMQVGERWLGLQLPAAKQFFSELGGSGLWAAIGDGKQAPFYRAWESHLRQWGGPSGWRARDGGRLRCDAEGCELAWLGGDAVEPIDGAWTATALNVLHLGTEREQVERSLRRGGTPPAASAADADFAGYDHLLGCYRFYAEGACRLRLPADPEERRVQVACQLPARAQWRCERDGEALPVQLGSIGRVDDPYAPHAGRPDDNGRPVLAAHEDPPSQLLTAVSLRSDRETELVIAPADGPALSYLGFDQRRELLLWHASDERRPLARLSLADCKLRDLRLPGAEQVELPIVPLYWFQMNAPSRWHSVNELVDCSVAQSDGAVTVELDARNPGGQLRSLLRCSLQAPSSEGLLMRCNCVLEILEPCRLPHLQFCNLFPEMSRMPEDWLHPETLAIDASGQRWVVDNPAPRGGPSRIDGERFASFRAPFVLSQYGGASGDYLLLVRGCEPADQDLGYELCRCWLDDHLFVRFGDDGPAVGSRFVVDYQLMLLAGRHDRAQIQALAEQALQSGELSTLSAVG